MRQSLITFQRALELAERGFQIWKDKPWNKKWFKRIDGTPIPGDLKVNIAIAIMEGLPADLPDERQNRIYRLERRIHNQRQQCRDTWEIIEMRRTYWMGSRKARQMYLDLLVRHQKLIREHRELQNKQPSFWKWLLS